VSRYSNFSITLVSGGVIRGCRSCLKQYASGGRYPTRYNNFSMTPRAGGRGSRGEEGHARDAPFPFQLPNPPGGDTQLAGYVTDSQHSQHDGSWRVRTRHGYPGESAPPHPPPVWAASSTGYAVRVVTRGVDGGTCGGRK